MRRSIIAVLALSGVVGAVGGAAAAGGPADATLAPDKTTVPTTALASVATSPAPPTVAAPPTSAWLSTTTVATAPTAPAITAPAATVPPATVAPATAVPPTSTATAGFDGLTFLTEVYAAVNGDPLTLLDIAESRAIVNSPADVFMAHLLGVTMTNRIHGGPPTPPYTVAVDGKGVSVCPDSGECDVFGSFVAPTGLVETFSINGVPIEDSFGIARREVVVESLSVDSTLCFVGTDAALSCVFFASSDGAATALSWDQAVFKALDGRQFFPDLTASAFAPSIADGGFGSAHLVFFGAPLEGDLTVPVVSGMSGIPSVASISVRAL